MPYPGPFDKDELLKITLLWGKYEEYDKVRWEFALYGELISVK